MIPSDPSQYPRRVLIAVVGLAPQVVTETLFALVVQRALPFLPTRVRLITTGLGAERIDRLLLDRDAGAFDAFATEYARGLAAILRESVVDVLTTAEGNALGDIADAASAARAADRIVAIVRGETADPEAAIWASIAGGRKTMGFLLGYAMSLFGRHQDRLSHVLVDPAFEDNPEFFFPPRRPRQIVSSRDGRRLDTGDARIVLSDVPFLRLRDGLPRRLLEGRSGFAETINEAQAALEPATMTFLVDRLSVRCRDKVIRMTPVDFAFLLWLAHRRLKGTPHGGAVNWRSGSAFEFLELHGRIAHRTPQAARVRSTLRHGIPKEWFEQRVTRINKLFVDALGLAAGPYVLRKSGGRPVTSYGLSPDLAAVRIVET